MFLSCMYHFIHMQILRSKKCFVTYITIVRLFSEVKNVLLHTSQLYGFSAVFAPITAVYGKEDNSYNVELNICQTLKEYYEQPAFYKLIIDFFKTKKGKKAKSHIYSAKKKFIKGKRRTRTYGNYDSTDYIEFNKFYGQNKNVNLKCDLIKPKLPFVSNEKQCKSIGEYYTQFDIKVLYNFYKHLFEVKKKTKRNYLTRRFTARLKKYVDKFNKSKSATKKSKQSKLLKIVINGFYKMKSSQIIPHYNEFYTFYTEKHTPTKKEKDHVDTEHCDYFKRIYL
ncbi:hypothetical protein AGLY_012276 [Aphis glycines]|uniref:Uncharacterized protein n=1 Tax=Aphis glycines TaxID=307491 RepID=A0A6G0TAY4_APHGL|nr:hypothetical protein AGLY_012276 [Aphis glycines]